MLRFRFIQQENYKEKFNKNLIYPINKKTQYKTTVNNKILNKILNSINFYNNYISFFISLYFMYTIYNLIKIEYYSFDIRDWLIDYKIYNKDIILFNKINLSKNIFDFICLYLINNKKYLSLLNIFYIITFSILYFYNYKNPLLFVLTYYNLLLNIAINCYYYYDNYCKILINL